MTDDDRDPTVQGLFAEAGHDLSDADFTATVMAQVARHERRLRWLHIAVGVVLVLAAGLITMPLVPAVDLMTQGLAVPLVGVEDRLLAQILAPVNSVAGVAALAAITAMLTFRALRDGVT